MKSKVAFSIQVLFIHNLVWYLFHRLGKLPQQLQVVKFETNKLMKVKKKIQAKTNLKT